MFQQNFLRVRMYELDSGMFQNAQGGFMNFLHFFFAHMSFPPTVFHILEIRL